MGHGIGDNIRSQDPSLNHCIGAITSTTVRWPRWKRCSIRTETHSPGGWRLPGTSTRAIKGHEFGLHLEPIDLQPWRHFAW